MSNITEDGHFTNKLNQVPNSSQAGILTFFSALNIFLSVTAFLGNALILIALHKVTSIYPPTKLFFRCLAATDLCVGVIVQPLYAICLMTPMSPNTLMRGSNFTYVFLVFNTLSWVSCSLSEMTSTAIAVDRLLALFLGLRYRHVVTLRRVRAVILCFWLIATSLGLIRLSWSSAITILLGIILVSVSLAISIFCYTRIHLKLRHQQAQVQNHVPQGQAIGGRISLNVAKYKKSVSSILCVQLALAACYVPWVIPAVLSQNGIENDVAWIAVLTLVLLNSSLNPILYCWKITQVKLAVKDTIRLLNCCANT